MNRTAFCNAKLVLPDRVIDNGAILIRDKKIEDISEGRVSYEDVHIIDVQGCYLSPGFIDLHVHGGGGHDFMDGTVESFRKVCELHIQHGTTGLYPTTLACTDDELFEMVTLLDKANIANKNGAAMLGLHLEGPYFSEGQRGAQDIKYLKKPAPEHWRKVLAMSENIRRWSMAPELEGALELGEILKKHGIIAAVAHTDATFEQTEEAVKHGFSLVTHLYSGMTGVRRIGAFRHAGTVEAGLYMDELSVEIISDGCHLPASLLKLIYKFKGADKTALVTDAMRGAGCPEGKSIMGSLKNGQEVVIEDGVAKLPDRTSFAGSVATADRLVRNMRDIAGVSLFDAVRMMSLTPAKIMGIESGKGSIEIGKDADLIVFDDDINIKLSMVEGDVRFYEKTKS